MASVLVAWELGAGLGHVANLLPIVRRVMERGDRVALAVRDLSVAPRIFAGLALPVWQAPFKSSVPKRHVVEPRTFADILFNCGFGDPNELGALIDAWRCIFQATKPDLAICEHSPSAILAARTVGCPVVNVGTGFSCPPAAGPWPDLRPWSKRPAEHVERVTAQVLANCNRQLARHDARQLSHLPELFQVCTELTTIPQLDPYAPRPRAHYHSAWPYWNAKPPRWPEASGKRLFAYLKSFATLPSVLGLLAETRLPTIIVCDGIDQRMQRQFSRPWLLFENDPIDLGLAMQQCDIAVCNGNHGTTIALLEAGKPALFLPLHLEHTLTAFAVQRAGAGLMATVRRPEQIAMRLAALLHDRSFADTAQRARGWFNYDQTRSLDEIVAGVERAM